MQSTRPVLPVGRNEKASAEVVLSEAVIKTFGNFLLEKTIEFQRKNPLSQDKAPVEVLITLCGGNQSDISQAELTALLNALQSIDNRIRTTNNKRHAAFKFVIYPNAKNPLGVEKFLNDNIETLQKIKQNEQEEGSSFSLETSRHWRNTRNQDRLRVALALKALLSSTEKTKNILQKELSADVDSYLRRLEKHGTQSTQEESKKSIEDVIAQFPMLFEKSNQDDLEEKIEASIDDIVELLGFSKTNNHTDSDEKADSKAEVDNESKALSVDIAKHVIRETLDVASTLGLKENATQPLKFTVYYYPNELFQAMKCVCSTLAPKLALNETTMFHRKYAFQTSPRERSASAGHPSLADKSPKLSHSRNSSVGSSTAVIGAGLQEDVEVSGRSSPITVVTTSTEGSASGSSAVSNKSSLVQESDQVPSLGSSPSSIFSLSPDRQKRDGNQLQPVARVSSDPSSRSLQELVLEIGVDLVGNPSVVNPEKVAALVYGIVEVPNMRPSRS